MTGLARDPTPPAARPRLGTIDLVRGIVMVLMALDHVRDFIHRGAMTASPTDFATTTPVLFMTRWVTHVCAPAFIFLAGVSAWLWWRQGRTKTKAALSRFLLARGLLLVVLELTVMRVAYSFDLSLRDPVLLLVLWVLGACMIGLAGLVWIPVRWLAAGSIAVILLHNLLDGVRAAQFGDAAPIWFLLHQVGAFPLDGVTVIVGYPLVPWVAVMAAGFSTGPIFERAPAERQRVLWRAGAGMVAAFIVLRLLNGYGDPVPWRPQTSTIFTVLSFIDTTKYPPSLAFLLMTLGPVLLALAYFDRHIPRGLGFVVVLGRVPLFYFVAHFYVAHLVAAVLAWVRYGGAARGFLLHPVPSMGGPRDLFPENFGYDLWVAYAVWIGVIALLYPVCRRLAALKAARRHEWLSYL